MRRRERELTASYLRLVADLEALLYRHDPIGIAFGDNTDEYSPEAVAIAPRISDARSADDILTAVHAVFVEWFGETAGPAARYRRIADEIWTLLGR